MHFACTVPDTRSDRGSALTLLLLAVAEGQCCLPELLKNAAFCFAAVLPVCAALQSSLAA